MPARIFNGQDLQALQKAYVSGGDSALARALAELKPALEPEGIQLAEASAHLFPLLRARHFSEAADLVQMLSERFTEMPEELLLFGIFATERAGRRREENGLPALRVAEHAAALGDSARAMELVKKIGTFADFGLGRVLLYDGAFLARQAAALELAAKPHLRSSPEPLQDPASKLKPRVAMVSINISGSSLAYVKTALQFAKYAARQGYEAYSYIVDENAARPQHSRVFKSDMPPSDKLAPELMARLRETSTVKSIPVELDWLQGSLWLAKEMERDGIDAAFFQGGTASPMIWMSCRLALIPAKVGLCLGFNMYQNGLDATVYMSNALNMEKERAFWRPDWGCQVFLHGGADIEEAGATASLKREDYQIPHDALTFGVLSNNVETRVGEEYLRCVARIMKACPDSIFVCMGPGKTDSQRSFMASEGLDSRCRWLSWQHRNAFASLKLLDFYFNEFPAGSAQSIIECMACGIPALAMLYGKNHHECVGADIVGPGFAIMERNPDAYATRAIEWLEDPQELARARKELSRRAATLYSAEGFIQQLCSLGLEIASSKRRGS